MFGEAARGWIGAIALWTFTGTAGAADGPYDPIVLGETEAFLRFETDQPGWVEQAFADRSEGPRVRFYFPSQESWSRFVEFGLYRLDKISADSILDGHFYFHVFLEGCPPDLVRQSPIKRDVLPRGFVQYRRLLGCARLGDVPEARIELVRTAQGESALYYARHVWRVAPFEDSETWPLPRLALDDALRRTRFDACSRDAVPWQCPAEIAAPWGAPRSAARTLESAKALGKASMQLGAGPEPDRLTRPFPIGGPRVSLPGRRLFGAVLDDQEYFLGTTADDPEWIVVESDGADGTLFALYHPSVEAWTRRVVFGAVAAEPGQVEVDTVLEGEFGAEGYSRLCDHDLIVGLPVSPWLDAEDPEFAWGYRQYTRLLGCRQVTGGDYGLLDVVRAAGGELAIYYSRHSWKLAPFREAVEWPVWGEQLADGLVRGNFYACSGWLKDQPCSAIVDEIEAARPGGPLPRGAPPGEVADR